MATWRELNKLYPTLSVQSPQGEVKTLSRRQAYRLLDLGFELVKGVAFDYLPGATLATNEAGLPITTAENVDGVVQVNAGGTGYEITDDLAFSQEVSGDIKGFYRRRSGYYFSGTATDTVIPVESVDTWLNAPLTIDALGLLDNRPKCMKESLSDPFNSGSGSFSFEGAPTNSFGIFVPALSFDPDEDGGELSVRLLMTHHSGTSPSTSSVEDVAGTMSQGADEDYVFEPSLHFPITQDMDTESTGDAGSAVFQVKSSVAGTVSVRALTYYLFA